MKDTFLQDFEWYLPDTASFWNTVCEQADDLARLGVTHVWLPPAYKGQAGASDVGYGVYDLFDLGEFDQKGTVPTKYGTLDQYLTAIATLHDRNIKVIGDIVLNHRMGADAIETVNATNCNQGNRLQDSSGQHEGNAVQPVHVERK